MDVMDVLVLGGTTRARQLATRLVAEGVDLCTSLAGRTSSPRPVPGPSRIGGFGGAEGLTTFLSDNDVRAVVDASHPFATTMHANAALACERANLPLLRLAPPSWRGLPESGAWLWVDDHGAAARAVADLPDSVLLTVGRQPVGHYLVLGPRRVIVRCIDTPDEELPEGWTVLRERGPFTVAREREIMATGVGTLVSKDSGGDTPDPKLLAAGEFGVRVVMISRGPTPQWGQNVGDVDEAVAWVAENTLPHV